MAMRATPWEFRHRTWLIFGIFCAGLACYWFDPHNSGQVFAGWLRAHVAFFGAHSRQSAARFIFLAGGLIVAIGGMIRAWGGAYLRAEVVQDSKVRTERLLADGPFRYTRNPLYLGVLTGVFGAGVMCSPAGWVVQTELALVFVYRLILREEEEMLATQGESFRAYCRSVPRLLPAIKAQVLASGARPHWGEALVVQAPWWGIAAACVTWAVTLRPSLAFAVAGAGFVFHVGQKYVVKKYRRSTAQPAGAR
jgi:protein-S-isoprenylcysteine O-methyltransferase Ste14